MDIEVEDTIDPAGIDAIMVIHTVIVMATTTLATDLGMVITTPMKVLAITTTLMKDLKRIMVMAQKNTITVVME